MPMSHSGQLQALPSGRENMATTEDTEEDGGNKKHARGARRRVAQACDRCRIRKDKCEAQKPVCSNCAENGRHCSYDMVAKKRGLPEGYVRGLEKLWGLAIREIDDVEDSMRSALDGRGSSTEYFDWDDRKTSDTLVDSWRKSQLSHELGRLLSDKGSATETVKRSHLDSEPASAKRPRIGQQTAEARASKPNGSADTAKNWTHIKPERSMSTSRDSSNAGLVDKDRIATTAYESILQPSYTQWSVLNSISNKTSTLPELPSETWNLLDVYFSYTHAWLPILAKHDVLRTSYQYSQSQHTISSHGFGAGEYAALWAAIALAKFQHRAINNIPLAQGSVADMVWTAERMYSQARSLIPDEEGNLELGHVQALLILALANIGMGHFNRAWLLVGQAVRLAIDLELNKPSDHFLTGSNHKSMVKYVFLGCFVLDTLLAARLGRRPHLRSDDVEIVGFVEEDGLEEWDPWSDILNVRRGAACNFRGPAALASTFNRLVQILQILNQTICLPDHSNSSALRVNLIEKLHAWNRTQQSPVPSTPGGKHTGEALLLLPHQYHVHCAYFATLATIRLWGYNTAGDEENTERCSDVAREIVEIFNQEATLFSLVIVPPTLEYFAKTAYDIFDAIHGDFKYDQVAVDNWKHNLDNCIDAMEPAWPVFSSLKERHSRGARHLARTESQVAYELMTGERQFPGSNGATQSHQGSVNDLKRRLNARDMTQPIGSSTSTANGFDNDPRIASGILQQISQQILPTAWDVGPSHFSPVAPKQAQLQLSSNNNLPGSSSTDLTLLTSQTPITPSPAVDPQILQPSPSTSNTNADPLYNEFATIDAVEWADTWDNFLVNLGFNDPDKMNHDFITMSKEPELPTDIFQQLVSNPSEKDMGALDGSAAPRRELGGEVGGFDMFDFGDENEGYEAGQILQSLSVAGELELFKNLGG